MSDELDDLLDAGSGEGASQEAPAAGGSPPGEDAYAQGDDLGDLGDEFGGGDAELASAQKDLDALDEAVAPEPAQGAAAQEQPAPEPPADAGYEAPAPEPPPEEEEKGEGEESGDAPPPPDEDLLGSSEPAADPSQGAGQAGGYGGGDAPPAEGGTADAVATGGTVTSSATGVAASTAAAAGAGTGVTGGLGIASGAAGTTAAVASGDLTGAATAGIATAGTAATTGIAISKEDASDSASAAAPSVDPSQAAGQVPGAPSAPSAPSAPEAPKLDAPEVPGAPEAPKVDAPKVDAPKVDAPKVDAPKAEAPKVDAPKVDAPKVDAPKAEAPKVDAPKVDAPKAEAPKVDAPKADAPKTDAPSADAAKADAAKADAPKADAPAADAAKADAPAADSAKADAAKADAPKADAPADAEQAGAEAGDAGMDDAPSADGEAPDAEAPGGEAPGADQAAGEEIGDPANPPGVEPATSAAVEESPAAATPAEGDGNFGARGLTKPADLQSLKGLTKVFKQAIDDIKPLAKDLKDGKLEPASVDRITAIVRQFAPRANMAKVKSVLGTLTGIFNEREGLQDAAKAVMEGGLSPESLKKVMDAVKKAVPGLDTSKIEAKVKQIKDLAVNHVAEFEKLKAKVDKIVTPEAAQKILGFAKKVFPGLQEGPFMKNIDKAVQLYKAASGNVDKVLEQFKKWFGPKEEPKDDAKEDEKKDDAKQDEKADEQKSDAKEEEAAEPETLPELTRWQPLTNVQAPAVLPFKLHVCKEGDKWDALASEAGVANKQELLRATFGSGVTNRRRVSNPRGEGPQPGEIIALPNKEKGKVKLKTSIVGFASKPDVEFQIFRQFREHGDPLAKVKGEPKNEEAGKATGRWVMTGEWEYEAADEHGERPQFVYRTVVKGGQTGTLTLVSKQSVGVNADWGDAFDEGAIKLARWMQEEGFLGTDANLEIKTQKIGDKTPVKVLVYRRPKRADDTKVQDAQDDAKGDEGKGDSKEDETKVDIGAKDDEAREDHFFEAIFKDAKGQALKDLAYLLTFPDGSKKEGVLGQDGRIHETGLLKAGAVTVEFKTVEAQG